MKLLVVKLSAFGDILHTLPALDDLLQRPEVEEIHWLVDSRYVFVTEIFPPQVKVTSVELKGAHPIRAAIHAIGKLRKEKFDAIIDLQGLIKAGMIARAIGSPVFGFDRNRIPEKPNALFTIPVCFHPEEKHVVQWYRRIAAAPFLENPQQQPVSPISYTPPRIIRSDQVGPPSTELPDELGVKPHRYILLNMGGGYPTKRLPDSTWRATAGQIVQRGYAPLLVWGSPEEQQRAKTIAGNNTAIKVMPRRLDTLSLCNLLRNSKMLISADTGILHLAAALDIQTVSFWGPTQPDTLGPLGDKHRHVIAPVACINCRKRACNDFVCMPKITPEMLLTDLERQPE